MLLSELSLLDEDLPPELDDELSVPLEEEELDELSEPLEEDELDEDPEPDELSESDDWLLDDAEADEEESSPIEEASS